MFRCIADLLKLQDASPCAPALRTFYGSYTLDLALLDQEQRFWGLGALSSNFEASVNHSVLLAAYRKVSG